MKYMLLIYADESRWGDLDEDQQRAIHADYMAVTQLPEVIADDRLQPASTATTVRVKDGETLTTDGPFLETKEALGGYYLVEADDLDAALEIAGRIPAARHGGAVEIRPVVER